MNFQREAEEILGRKLQSNEGIEISKMLEQEETLNATIPLALKEFYASLGKNILFMDGFQHFAGIKNLFIKDEKLVFLQENQSVVYWAVDLRDQKTIFQTTNQNFNERVEWFKEDLELDEFLKMMLYFQCIMSDESHHIKAESRFEYFASLSVDEYPQNVNVQDFTDRIDASFRKVVKESGLSIYCKPDTIIMYFINSEAQVSDMVLSCTKSKKVLDRLIEDFGFSEL